MHAEREGILGTNQVGPKATVLAYGRTLCNRYLGQAAMCLLWTLAMVRQKPSGTPSAWSHGSSSG